MGFLDWKVCHSEKFLLISRILNGKLKENRINYSQKYKLCVFIFFKAKFLIFEDHLVLITVKNYYFLIAVIRLGK